MAKKTCESRNRSPEAAKRGIHATLDILFGHLHTSIILLLIQNLTHLFEVLVEVLVLDPLVLSVKVNHLGSVDRGGPIEDGGWIAKRERKKRKSRIFDVEASKLSSKQVPSIAVRDSRNLLRK